MVKFKCKTEVYNVIDVKKVKSQRGNDYQLIIVKDSDDRELYFYDPKISDIQIGNDYLFDLIVTISKYSSAEVTKAWKIERQ